MEGSTRRSHVSREEVGPESRSSREMLTTVSLSWDSRLGS